MQERTHEDPAPSLIEGGNFCAMPLSPSQKFFYKNANLCLGGPDFFCLCKRSNESGSSWWRVRPTFYCIEISYPTPYIHDRPHHRAEQGGGRVRLPLPGLRHGRDAGRDVQRGPQDQGARRRASQDLRLALVVRALFFGRFKRSPPFWRNVHRYARSLNQPKAVLKKISCIPSKFSQNTSLKK